MSGESRQLRIGLVGYGHWGPNHVRVFNDLDGCRVTIVADRNPQRLQVVGRQAPGTATTTDFDAVIHDPDVDAVVVATPTVTHHSLVKAALLSGKDVLVEKPISYTAKESAELVELARERERILM